MRNLDNFRQAMESPKSGNSMGYVLLSKKYILSAKTLYTEDLSNITFNYLCENSPNSSCHFSNKKSVFLQSLDLFSVSWEIILLYFFSWNFICYWEKQHIKVQTFRLATAHIKIHQIPHVIFGTKSQFFFKRWTLFSVIRHNTSVHFHLNLYLFWTKETHRSANF